MSLERILRRTAGPVGAAQSFVTRQIQTRNKACAKLTNRESHERDEFGRIARLACAAGRLHFAVFELLPVPAM
ncbi:MAG: hypothetical protein AAGD03_23150, partial [Bordetella sp.]|nr:hypothetical protein [Pseudomonadota bacterium]